MTKLGRNDPCHCGSGKKYKHCCGKLVSTGTGLPAFSASAALQAAFEHHRAGRLPEAETLYHRVLQLEPNHPDALHHLGLTALQSGKSEVAVDFVCKAMGADPSNPIYHNTLANALKELGRLREAVASLRKAIELKPDFAMAHNNLGNLLKEMGQLDEAAESYRQALSFKPDDADAHANLGNVLKEQGRLDDAVASLRTALSFQPNHAKAYYNLGTVFNEQGLLDAAVESYRKALLFQPDYAIAHSNLQFALQFYPHTTPAELIAASNRFAAQCEAPLKAQWRPHANPRAPEKRLQVGYLSPDFRRHAVAFFIEPVLANHDKERIEVCCYYNNSQHDEFTARLAGYSDRWLDCKWMTDSQLAERIRADGIDILVDLAGHTANNRMLTLARKPAPIQITYLGYPGTSGLAAMDYRLTDGCADPAGNDAYYTEKLLRLPDSLWCFRPGKDMPEVTALPAQRNGYITFGSFNNFNKVDALCIKLWAQLLQAVPDSRLLMVTVPEGGSRQRLKDQFVTHGIAADRLEFHGKLPGNEFYRMLQRVDLSLDPITVNGATTTCESLWLGVPVISLTGKRFLERAGFSILNATGLLDFAAKTPEDYIGIARHFASNLQQLAQLRAGLRARVAGSPLVDEVKFTQGLEELYRNVWTDWCKTGS